MMKALRDAGHHVSLLTKHECQTEATQGLQLSNRLLLGSETELTLPQLSWLQNRYCSFWGIDQQAIAEVQKVAARIHADVVVAVGLDVLPYLAAIREAKRVWYAADEWVLHHWTQLSLFRKDSWHHVRDGAIKGVYERAFANKIDRVWVVSQRDALATRLVMHRPSVDIVVNGVDSEQFAPDPQPEQPLSCVFWGRLDFGPNVDAIRWFAKTIWPEVLMRHPQASFTLYGFQPIQEIIDLVSEYGFAMKADMPDIRSAIQQHQVVVLPFVSGAGIKNKFLEAAALARPIIASKMALNGVQLYKTQPCWLANSKSEWVQQLSTLWNDEPKRHALGAAARLWVTTHYTWDAAASKAIQALTR